MFIDVDKETRQFYNRIEQKADRRMSRPRRMFNSKGHRVIGVSSWTKCSLLNPFEDWSRFIYNYLSPKENFRQYARENKVFNILNPVDLRRG